MIAARALTPDEFRENIPRLGHILADAVNGGAGVSFMLPFSDEDGAAYWANQTSGVESGYKIIFGAFDGDEIIGTVTLDKAWPPNQPHRGDIAKMLVLSSHRRRGVGKLLLDALEAKAREMRLTLLTFDTVSDSPAESFYRGLGFTCIGRIPDYALSPSGKPDATSIFYKKL